MTYSKKKWLFFFLSAKRNELSIPKEDLLEPILPSEAIVAAFVWFLLVSKFSSKYKRINNFQIVTIEASDSYLLNRLIIAATFRYHGKQVIWCNKYQWHSTVNSNNYNHGKYSQFFSVSEPRWLDAGRQWNGAAKANNTRQLA